MGDAEPTKHSSDVASLKQEVQAKDGAGVASDSVTKTEPQTSTMITSKPDVASAALPQPDPTALPQAVPAATSMDSDPKVVAAPSITDQKALDPAKPVDDGDRDTLDAPPKQPLNLENPSGAVNGAPVKSMAPKETASGSAVVSRTQSTAPDATSDGKNAIAATNPITQAATLPQASVDKPQDASKSIAEVKPPAAATVPPADNESAIDRAREPLTKLYGKYLCPTTDTSLADARKRLKRAIEQTRILRQSFTERVYSKYRICLHPPKPTEQIISEIEKDPTKLFRELSEQTEVIREEKELERQEAARLNADLSSAERLLPHNVDNAELLMYLTSGLNLVILPEDEGVEKELRQGQFTERGPMDEAGQRARNISQASAIAAELVLERTRKATAMRVERQRLKQLQLLRGEDSGKTDAALFTHLPGHSLKSGTSAADKAKAPTATHGGGSKSKMTQYHRPAPKGGRPRSQSSASSNVLLNLNPVADEVKITSKPRPATEALASRGVGPSASKPMQVRLRHPHPESLGGIRRTAAVSDHASSAVVQQLSQANVANTLPPLPAAKDQLDRRPLPTSEPKRRPTASVQHVLRHFARDADATQVVDVPKLNFLNAVRRFEPPREGDGTRASSVNPFLVVSVLHAVGLVTAEPGDKQQTFDIDKINPKNRALNSDRFRQILKRINKTKDRTVVKEAVVPTPVSAKRKAEDISDPEAKKSRSGGATPGLIEAASIRGGGEVLADAVERPETADASVKEPTDKSTGSATDTSNGPDNKKRRRSPSPAHSEVTNRPAPTPADRAPVVPGGRPAQHVSYQVPNSQVGRQPNPAPGELAYLSGMPDRRQQLFDMQHQIAQGQLASFGFAPNPGLMGYTFHEHTAATQAILAREHQAAALLGSYSHGGFHPPAANNASMSSFLAASMPRAPGPKNPTESSSSQSRSASSLDALSRQVVQQTEAKTASTKNSVSSQKDVTESSKPPAPSKESQADSAGAVKRAPLQKNPEVSPPAMTAKVGVSSTPKQVPVPQVTDASMKKTLQGVLTAAAKVPIPRGLVLGPLKERLNTPGFKNAGKNGAPLIDKDVVVASILVWLWDSHGPSFQRAFETNGRFDVDPDCKWLIQVAVDTVVSELSLEIANSVASGKGTFAGLSMTDTTKPSGPGSSNSTEPKPPPSSLTVKEKVDFSTVSIVSKSLGVKLRIDNDLNKSIANQASYVELLDEARLGALRAKSRERVLLANLLAQNTMVTDNFTNAYVSAVIRAGEALGHEKLFEIAHEDDQVFSTLTPQDIFADDHGVWEDSCRPDMGFTKSLTGDQLLRRAHARASIQKSMRKLQDRYQIRGGTPHFGPFMESQLHPTDGPIGAVADDKNPASPRGMKRRASSMTEQAFIVPGTGSCEARNLSDYEPKHTSFPLDWDTTSKSSSPYGIHLQSAPVQIASLRPGLNALSPASISHAPSDSNTPGTFEINWSQVATTFQSVELPRKAIRPRGSSDHGHEDARIPPNGAIVAPFCTQINDDQSLSEDDSDGGEDEDLTDETILAKHQKVLDEMKGKLEAYLEERKKFQDKRKNRHSK